jgi:hypothetical protein
VAPKRQHRIPIAKLLALAFAAQTIPRLAAASLHSSIPRERKYHPTVRFALMRGVRWQWYLCGGFETSAYFNIQMLWSILNVGAIVLLVLWLRALTTLGSGCVQPHYPVFNLFYICILYIIL